MLITFHGHYLKIKNSIPMLFGAAVVLFSIGFPWFIRISFFLYSAFVFWVLSDIRQSWSTHHGDSLERSTIKRGEQWLAPVAILSLCFLLLTRLIPFLRFGEAPLGYDTGFYVGAIKSLFHPGSPTNAALYLILTPFLATGLPPNFLLHFFHLLFQVLIAGSLYFLLSSFTVPIRNRLTVCALALFSLSVIQFSGYWWMFTQQMLGMGFFMMTLALFIRGSLWTVFFALITFLVHISTGAALLLTFIVFYLIYGVQLFFRGRYYCARATTILAVGILVAPLVFFLKKADISNIFSDVLGPYGIFLKNVPQLQLNAFRGLFFGADAFRLLTLGFVPFSLFTTLHPSTWIRQQIDRPFFYQKLLILYGALFILLLLTFLPIIYQTRFSIILDLLLLVFAAPAFLLFVEFFSHDHIGRLLLGLLFSFFFVSIGLHVQQQPSMISSQELRDIKKMSSLLGSGAGILATDSLYAPWLWGFFGPSTVSPGYLGDGWDYATWAKFWSGTSDERRLRLLETRDHPQPPMYIYIGERQTRGLPFEKFVRTSPAFTQITPNLWKFTSDPRAPPGDLPQPSAPNIP